MIKPHWQADTSRIAGRYQDAIEACEEARGLLDEQACSGLAAALLTLQAKAHLGRGQYSGALEFVEQAVALHPGHAASLLVRSQVQPFLQASHAALELLSCLQIAAASAFPKEDKLLWHDRQDDVNFQSVLRRWSLMISSQDMIFIT